MDLAQSAGRHGVLPLVYRNLKRAAPDLVPAPAAQRLRRGSRLVAARNLALTCELAEAIELLGAHGVRALAFKGPVLSASLFGTPCVREFVDLDVLVASRDARSALDLLVSRGYEKAQTAEALPDRSSPDGHVSLVRADTGANLDLQWDLGVRWELQQVSPRAPLDFEELWSRREAVPVCGGWLPSLSAEDLILALCVHAARHRWTRLVWLCDIAELIRARSDLGWRRVFGAAAEWHCRRRLCLALLLASDVLGAALPPCVRGHITSDPAVPAIAARVRSALLVEPPATDRAGAEARPLLTCASDLDELAFCVSVRDRRIERLRVWLRYLYARLRPNEMDRQVLRLPKWLGPVHSLIRPARLLHAYGPDSIWRALRSLWAL